MFDVYCVFVLKKRNFEGQKPIIFFYCFKNEFKHPNTKNLGVAKVHTLISHLLTHTSVRCSSNQISTNWYTAAVEYNNTKSYYLNI